MRRTSSFYSFCDMTSGWGTANKNVSDFRNSEWPIPCVTCHHHSQMVFVDSVLYQLNAMNLLVSSILP